MNEIESRKKLFEIYSRNIAWVKSNSNVSFEPDFEEGYVCPLCFRVFDKPYLKQDSENPLTYEHNPPASLGGKSGVLTCKECNSKCGSQIDSYLFERIKDQYFNHHIINQLPIEKTRINLKSDKFKLAADFEVDQDKGIKINIDRKNSNPLHFNNFLANKTYTYKAFDLFLEGHDLFQSGLSWHLNFTVSRALKINDRNANIALLKIAYLYAFEKFGYSFLIHPALYKVREQILYPQKEVLPKVFWIKYPFPENMTGINIVNEPDELKCFLVVFNLIIQNSKLQFGIALPGFSEPSLKIYENIESLLCQENNSSINISIEHIIDEDYATKEKWTFAAHQIWENLTL